MYSKPEIISNRMFEEMTNQRHQVRMRLGCQDFQRRIKGTCDFDGVFERQTGMWQRVEMQMAMTQFVDDASSRPFFENASGICGRRDTRISMVWENLWWAEEQLIGDCPFDNLWLRVSISERVPNPGSFRCLL